MFEVHLARVDATEDFKDNFSAVTIFIEAVDVERTLKAAVAWCSQGDEKHRACYAMPAWARTGCFEVSVAGASPDDLGPVCDAHGSQDRQTPLGTLK